VREIEGVEDEGEKEDERESERSIQGLSRLISKINDR